MFVKICGCTNEADALLAVAMGADAVGFILAPSGRQIAPTLARDIARRLPAEILTIGVFRDESPERVVELVNANGLRGAQLHGHESAAQTRWVSERVPFCIKAFAATDPALDRIDEFACDAVLIDSPSPGSGEVFDWSIIEGIPDNRRIILAGGLDPTNVAEAIERVKPWGVDVASGVEAVAGRKDAVKVRHFVNAAKAGIADIDLADLSVLDLDELAEELAQVPDVYDWQVDS